MPVDISARVTQEKWMANKKTCAFSLSSSTLLNVNKGSIINWFVNGRSDAIVNSTNEQMCPVGGCDLAINRAAGPQLLDMCYNFPQVWPGVRCPMGEAWITPGFKLPASHVIHTVGPVRFDGRNPLAIMRNAYRSSLPLAKANKIQYVAFPAICCGIVSFPLEEAATVAISTIKEFAGDFKEIHFVLFMNDEFNVWMEKTCELLLH